MRSDIGIFLKIVGHLVASSKNARTHAYSAKLLHLYVIVSYAWKVIAAKVLGKRR